MEVEMRTRVETTGKQGGMVPFWVLEPILDKLSYSPKICEKWTRTVVQGVTAGC